MARKVERVEPDELTPQQKVFCEYYVTSFDTPDAADWAGVALTTARRWLGLEKIQEYIEELLATTRQRLEIERHRLVHELMNIAYSDPRDFFEWEKDEKDADGLVKYGRILWRSSSDIGPKMKAVKMVKESVGNTYSKQIHFHDKFEAMKLLALFMGVKGLPNDPNSGSNGSESDPMVKEIAKMTPAERRARVQFLRGVQESKDAFELHKKSVEEHGRHIIDAPENDGADE